MAVPTALVSAGCTGGAGSDAARAAAVPTPSAQAAALCRALHRELPGSVDGLRRRAADPPSDFTAVWGDPAVRLRCGVPRPALLDPGSPRFRPDADAAEVNGVEWLTEKLDDGYRFTTVLRKAFVEVTVPRRYAPEVNPLLDLAAAVRRTVPVGVV
ncbi:DUF3515 domain-containing protein [Streptomyces sp. B1866]|uniref:DUF3515 domain-containing protein n=1 Tax=Streptomyces sp. B1866 TaxID=3075431 RepID=UPI00288F9BF2|nr:DUF3515 domain-containing protein [Streptomyces sp. B1866]MDT3400471.1 DUF3515 domain-containing protein [Streptomyces sp. B1866]